MILRRLIREFVSLELRTISEGFIDVPDEVIDKLPELLRTIKANFQDIDSNVYTGQSYNDPYNPDDLRGFFKLKSRDGKDMSVDIGFYNLDDKSWARMNAHTKNMLFNLDKFNSWSSLEAFEDTVIHELTHALDTFLTHPSYIKYYEKHGATTLPKEGEVVNPKTGLTAQQEKLRKAQEEYAAFLTPMIKKARRYVQGDNEKINGFIRLAADIPNLNPSELAEKYEWIFGEDINKILAFLSMDALLSWSTRPKMFKKFLVDLSSGLGAGNTGNRKTHVGTEVL